MRNEYYKRKNIPCNDIIEDVIKELADQYGLKILIDEECIKDLIYRFRLYAIEEMTIGEADKDIIDDLNEGDRNNLKRRSDLREALRHSVEELEKKVRLKGTP